MEKFEIIEKRLLAPNIVLMKVYAPRIAQSAKPGQFLIVIVDDKSERIPLTICDFDASEGTITIVTQSIGASTIRIVNMNVGQCFHNFAGPLGHPSELIEFNDQEIQESNVVFVAGGLGAAPVYPQVKYLASRGAKPHVILGAKSENFLIMEKEFRALTPNVHIATDDGSAGFHGLVTDLLKQLTDAGEKFSLAVAIGPMIMMKFVALTTKQLGVKTIVSLNTMMVDGTGMCGACRVTVAGKTRFACVEGPEFDGHEVDFDEALRRGGMYRTIEARKKEREEQNHKCNIGM